MTFPGKERTPQPGERATPDEPGEGAMSDSAIRKLRDAGERMFRELGYNLGCGHIDPRHPRNDECPYCCAKRAPMDAWDAALVEAAPALALSE